MDSKLEPLILDLLEWMSRRPRSHSEVMATWKTSCPQLTVWEDAQEAGLVEIHRKAGGLVWFEVSGVGRKFLEAHRPQATTDVLTNSETHPTRRDLFRADGDLFRADGDLSHADRDLFRADEDFFRADRDLFHAERDLFRIDRELFRTDRLLVRHLDYPDFDDLYAVYSDPEAMRWVDDGEPIQAEDCFRWIEITHKNYASRGYGMSALVLLETGNIIGFCGLVHPGGQEDVEIKYALKRSVWGQGLATEAVRGMLDYAHREHRIETIIATVAPENSGSTNVLKKAGLRESRLVAEDDGTQTAVFVWGSATPPA